ncbi:uncharacterized protein TDEL_0E01170 [Torulaspora delbrueckii]|uniref:Uncharacterized protein n=1 Tax=Torulaspora delbrueckii TaxID=4950 RepID=G8ZUR6_TORDE|nr:hypothetical protein TDEL_0E01170 [Torulaspora delbrueckii]CCE92360.1 hypothetical protein TDEL_0E01170 [Torulaspora delbrueckii]
MLANRLYSSYKTSSGPRRPSPHALMYRKWAKPVGKLLTLSIGSYYTLFYLWEYLERSELEYEKSRNI